MRSCLFVIVFVMCACSSTSGPYDAGSDAQSDATPSDATSDATDADSGGCVVQTCNGTVSLYLGQTIPYGDDCNAETCSWKGGGGLSMCGCTYISGCSCPDAH
jgi:hypothetical protein